MNLLNEIQQIKHINSQLLELLDQLVRKQVLYERLLLQQKEIKSSKLDRPPEKSNKETKKMWVRAGDICRSKKNPDSLLPISLSNWYLGVKEGRFPQPKKLGRMSLWKMEDIQRLVDSE